MDEKRFILSCASEEQKNAILNGLWMSYQFAYANADKNVYGNWEIYTQVKMSQRKISEMTTYALGIVYGLSFAKIEMGLK